MSTVAIAAGVAGGIVGVILLVAVCTCAVWITRHVQVHVHYIDKEQQGGKENNDTRREDANSSEVELQENAAYCRVGDKNRPTGAAVGAAEETIWINRLNGRGDQISCQMACDCQGHATTDNNSKFIQGWQREKAEVNVAYLAVPLANKMALPRKNSEDHLYESI